MRRYLDIDIIPNTFAQTYSKALDNTDKKSLFYSILSAITGVSYKYKYKYVLPKKADDTAKYTVELIKDNNIYNWLELVFISLTLPKNIAKLGTEFIWNLASNSLLVLADYCALEGGSFFGHPAFVWLLRGIRFIPWIIAKIGQSITSPFAAIKESYAYFAINADLQPNNEPGARAMGYLAAGLRSLFILAIYTAIAAFAAPLLAAPLAAYAWGSKMLAGLATAANWIASLPILNTLGSVAAAGISSLNTALGLSVSNSVISASAAAATTLAVAPLLAGLKAIVRKLSPWKNKEKPTAVPAILWDENEPLIDPSNVRSDAPNLRLKKSPPSSPTVTHNGKNTFSPKPKLLSRPSSPSSSPVVTPTLVANTNNMSGLPTATLTGNIQKEPEHITLDFIDTNIPINTKKTLLNDLNQQNSQNTAPVTATLPFASSTPPTKQNNNHSQVNIHLLPSAARNTTNPSTTPLPANFPTQQNKQNPVKKSLLSQPQSATNEIIILALANNESKNESKIEDRPALKAITDSPGLDATALSTNVPSNTSANIKKDNIKKEAKENEENEEEDEEEDEEEEVGQNNSMVITTSVSELHPNLVEIALFQDQKHSAKNQSEPGQHVSMVPAKDLAEDLTVTQNNNTTTSSHDQSNVMQELTPSSVVGENKSQPQLNSSENSQGTESSSILNSTTNMLESPISALVSSSTLSTIPPGVNPYNTIEIETTPVPSANLSITPQGENLSSSTLSPELKSATVTEPGSPSQMPGSNPALETKNNSTTTILTNKLPKNYLNNTFPPKSSSISSLFFGSGASQFANKSPVRGTDSTPLQQKTKRVRAGSAPSQLFTRVKNALTPGKRTVSASNVHSTPRN